MVKKKQQKVVLPPLLPPEVADEDIDVSDDDVKYVTENAAYAVGVTKLDTKSITKHVSRVANVKDDGKLEAVYETRRLHTLEKQEKGETVVDVDPVDALPVKDLHGNLSYRRAKEQKSVSVEEVKEEEKDPSLVKTSKAEKRAKFKKARKEAKQQAKDEEHQAPRADVLDEVQKDLSAEEAKEGKKYKLAELGTSLLEDPESNIKNLKEMLEISKDGDSSIVILGLKSLLAVFRDIIPGYRIRLPTEKEQEMKVSKVVKKTRYYESTLLSAYKAYVQKLVALQKQPAYRRVAVRCLCILLEAVPHFNFRDSLLSAVVDNISSEDEIVRKFCCSAIKSLFTEEGKHGGEVTVEAVKLIAEVVKAHHCQLHPDSVEVLLSLHFDDDFGKQRRLDADNRIKDKKSKKRKGKEEPNDMPENERKKSRKEIVSKTRDEVNADYKAATFAQDPEEKKMMQTLTLKSLFEIYFRILKHSVYSISAASDAQASSEGHPLLNPCLNGIGKFTQLLDLDYMADLMNCLRKLAGSRSKLESIADNSSNQLTVSERLRCCIVAFRVMKNNLDALNVDLQDFYVEFYNLILEYRQGRDQGEVLAEALKIMLCDDRQHDMLRAAAFVKRLATFSLYVGSAEAMAALVTIKQLIQKNAKCRNLLENEAGGGSVTGSVATYQPYATDPNQSGALASVLWELNLLKKHYHPAVSAMASSISTMLTSTELIVHSHISPQQAYEDLLQKDESYIPPVNLKQGKNKKRGNDHLSDKVKTDLEMTHEIDENEVRKKLSDHFLVLRDIQENKRLRSELDRTTLSVKLYDDYKKQKKQKTRKVKG